MPQIPIAPDENAVAANGVAVTPESHAGQGKAPAPDGNVNPVTIGLILLAVVGLSILRPEIAKTALVFIVTLSILVFVHEWGHFQFARWAGMKVNRFAIGFPPFIYTKKYRGIDYSVGALPIGGMVDIAGLGSEEEMVHSSKDHVEGLLERTNVGERSEKAQREWAAPGQGKRKQFQEANLGWRFLVLFAGPLMNFILAILIFVGLLSIVGAPDMSNAKMNRVGATLSSSPASKAGVQPGDLIMGVGDVKTDDAEKISELIRKTPAGQTVDLQLKRAGKPVTVPVTPELKTIPIGGVDKKVPTVGIAFDVDPATITKYNRLSVFDATKQAFASSIGMSTQILNLVKRAFTGKLTDMDKGGVGGPVAIAKAAKSSSDAGYYTLLLFGASLSINLGLLNLLPLPALDGGRILFLGYELIMRRPLDPRKEGFVHAAGMVLLLAFMLFITLRDVIQL